LFKKADLEELLFILWRASCRKAFPILQRSFDLRGFSCKAEITIINSSSVENLIKNFVTKTCVIYVATMLSITGSTNFLTKSKSKFPKQQSKAVTILMNKKLTRRKCLEPHQFVPLKWVVIVLQRDFYRKSCPPLHRSFSPPCFLYKAGKGRILASNDIFKPPLT